MTTTAKKIVIHAALLTDLLEKIRSSGNDTACSFFYGPVPVID
jgi:hypothetical protein